MEQIDPEGVSKLSDIHPALLRDDLRLNRIGIMHRLGGVFVDGRDEKEFIESAVISLNDQITDLHDVPVDIIAYGYKGDAIKPHSADQELIATTAAAFRGIDIIKPLAAHEIVAIVDDVYIGEEGNNEAYTYYIPLDEFVKCQEVNDFEMQSDYLLGRLQAISVRSRRIVESEGFRKATSDARCQLLIALEDEAAREVLGLFGGEEVRIETDEYLCFSDESDSKSANTVGVRVTERSFARGYLSDCQFYETEQKGYENIPPELRFTCPTIILYDKITQQKAYVPISAFRSIMPLA